MKSKIISVIICICCLLILCGCSNKYHAVLHSHAEKLVSEEFLKENRVKGYYIDDYYVEGESDPSSKYIYYYKRR